MADEIDINLYQNVLNKFPFPLVIWRQNDGEIICYFSNGILQNLEKGDSYDKYIENKSGFYSKMKNTTEDEVIIKTQDKTIFLTRISSDYFYEFHESVVGDNFHLLSIVSHKIRGPLTNIIGILTLLEDLNLNSVQKKYLRLIKKSSLEVVTLANDIIDLINLTQNRIKLKISPINIRKCLYEAMEMIKPNANKKKLQFTLNVDDKVPEVILGDCDRIKQILLCLVSNAIQYTSQGSVIVSVELFEKPNISYPYVFKKSKPPHCNILFKVKDTGVGIDNDKAEIMRDMLLIEKGNKYISYKTCGFSLMISRYLTELMDGGIWFESHIDIGTVFYFNIVCDALDLDG